MVYFIVANSGLKRKLMSSERLPVASISNTNLVLEFKFCSVTINLSKPSIANLFFTLKKGSSFYLNPFMKSFQIDVYLDVSELRLIGFTSRIYLLTIGLHHCAIGLVQMISFNKKCCLNQLNQLSSNFFSSKIMTFWNRFPVPPL